jgi:hypothetical protein
MRAFVFECSSYEEAYKTFLPMFETENSCYSQRRAIIADSDLNGKFILGK